MRRDSSNALDTPAAPPPGAEWWQPCGGYLRWALVLAVLQFVVIRLAPISFSHEHIKSVAGGDHVVLVAPGGPGATPPENPIPRAQLVAYNRLPDPVIIAESNTKFHGMTRWWIDNMKKLNPPITNFVIVALDAAEYRRLHALNVTVAYKAGMDMNYNETRYGTSTYHQIVNYKWQLVVDVLRSGRSLLLTDVDIHWRRNPLPYIYQLPKCDMYFSTNVITLPEVHGKLRVTPPFPWKQFHNWVNTGFIFLRAKPNVIKLAQHVLRKPISGQDDQYTFNTYFEALLKKRKRTRMVHGPKDCAYYGDLTFHFLRPDLFPNRRMYDHYINATDQFKDYYALHFNWLWDYASKVDYMVDRGFMDRRYTKLDAP